MAKRATTALAPWFGSNRTLAANVGAALKGCRWVGVPFAGGMCELAHIEASTLVVSDLHRWIINLARVVKDAETKTILLRELESRLFHPDELWQAQKRMQERNSREPFFDVDIPAAVDFFVCAWMGRSAKSGTGGEFEGSLPTRWNANGGDSNTRFRSAVKALDDWHAIFQRCNFHVRDVFDFLAQVNDEPGHGLYLDPPFPGPGDDYRHKFDEASQRRLAGILGTFAHCRVVCRFYDHPLIRELYPDPQWGKWHRFEGRTQANKIGPEVLIVRN